MELASNPKSLHLTLLGSYGERGGWSHGLQHIVEVWGIAVGLCQEGYDSLISPHRWEPSPSQQRGTCLQLQSHLGSAAMC